MRSAKSIISEKRISKGFSIAEIIFAVTIFTTVLTAIVGSSYLLYNGFARVKSNAVKQQKMAKFLENLAEDVYSVDIYPRYAGEEFVFEESLIQFTVQGLPVEYRAEEEHLVISRGKDETEYDFIKEFTVKYYDSNDFETMDDEYPHYCVLNFTFYNKKKVSLTVKL